MEEYGDGCYTELPGQGLLLEREFVSYDNMRQWVLSFGANAQVWEPAALREDLRRQAKALWEKYQK